MQKDFRNFLLTFSPIISVLILSTLIYNREVIAQSIKEDDRFVYKEIIIGNNFDILDQQNKNNKEYTITTQSNNIAIIDNTLTQTQNVIPVITQTNPSRKSMAS